MRHMLAQIQNRDDALVVPWLDASEAELAAQRHERFVLARNDDPGLKEHHYLAMGLAHMQSPTLVSDMLRAFGHPTLDEPWESLARRLRRWGSVWLPPDFDPSLLGVREDGRMVVHSAGVHYALDGDRTVVLSPERLLAIAGDLRVLAARKETKP